VGVVAILQREDEVVGVVDAGHLRDGAVDDVLDPVELGVDAVQEAGDGVHVGAVGRSGVQHRLQQEGVVGGLPQLLADVDAAGQDLGALEAAGVHRQRGAVTVAAVEVHHLGAPLGAGDGPGVAVDVAVDPHGVGELRPGAGVLGAAHRGDVDAVVHRRDEVDVDVALLEAGLDVRLADGGLRLRQGHARGGPRDGDDLQLELVAGALLVQRRGVVALGEDQRGVDALLAHERGDGVELAVEGRVLDVVGRLVGPDLDVLRALLEGLAGGVEVVTDEVDVEVECQHE